MPQDLINQHMQRLSSAQQAILNSAETIAEEWRVALYLVGGSVRDLLLERPHIDVDITVEGDAIALAKAVAARTGSELVFHRAFGTASLRSDGFIVDLATARSETYPRPGALPVVKPSTLADDLARRDFTINAMALALTGPRRGELVDPFGGRDDLSAGCIRILHDASFRDDATRILRAARYAVRLAFQIDKHTRALAVRDAPYLRTISGARLHRELILALAEERPEDILLLWDSLQALTHIHPALRFYPSLAEAFRLAREEVPHGQLQHMYLAVLGADLTVAEAEAVSQRLALASAQRRAVVAAALIAEQQHLLHMRPLTPSVVAERLSAYPPESLWATLLVYRARGDATAAETICRYLHEWRRVRPILNGNALKELGVPEGPLIGEILSKLTVARLNGQVTTKEDEIHFVQEALKALTRTPSR